MRILLVVVEIICSLALIGLILIQRSKSEGLGLAFGAGMGESLFGSRAGNILQKLTVIFAAVFLVTTTLLALTYSGDRAQSLMSSQMMGRPAAPVAPSGPIAGPGPDAPAGMGLQEAPAAQPASPMEPAAALPAEAPAPVAEPQPAPAAE
ncbi:MAG TPA: preprotein translocase subunit SecG [Kiritimatiellia bacterium]|nr:preprotein translocase subunit SecG [Kiritimatiellia bacterium]